ncbi:MAG: PEP-utilizing enzyme, partial [Myxococcales bacterium]|nr:PEP-utilizing enzyme [Myxococcales bacterium]
MSAPLASRRLLGIVASHGVAVGPVMILDRQGQAIPRRRLHGGEAPSEQERLRRAIDASRAEIESVRGQLSEAHLRDYGLILDAHLLMHRDELLAGAAIRAIADDRMNAEWALRRTIESLKAPLLGAGSRYFRERAEDIEHVGRHILGHLGGGAGMALPPLDQPVILFSQDLSPADAARLLKSRVEGLVTVGGSPTGHTALLARALEVPAVVGVSGALELAAEARMAIVDGSRAEVWFDPDEACRQEAASRADRYRRFFVDLRARRREPARTRDGIVCSVFANVELPVEAAMVAEEGGEGIGLYRTEFLYLEHDAPPSEQEQVQIYSDVVRAVGDRPVTFRTFDLGGDKLPLRLPVGPNPALGQRGVRLSLAEEGQFREQVRALLKAAVHGDLRIMLPLISGVGELREARRIVEACARELEEAGIAHATVPIGVMIEVPSAALTADILAQ